MPGQKPKTMRLNEEDWALFREMHLTVEKALPGGRLSQADFFKICVNSTAAAIQAGTLPVTTTTSGEKS